MKITRLFALLFFMSSTSAYSQDFLCDSPPPFPHPHSSLNFFAGSFDQRHHILSPVDLPKLIVQVKKNDPSKEFSDSEKKRQAESASCTAAYNNLLKVFNDNHEKMQYPPYFDKGGLAIFINWYFDSSTKPEQLEAAKPVIEAQKKYASACLSSTIPNEMLPDKIVKVVGLLTLGDSPFCGALRYSPSEIITAKHCFVDARTGALTANANTAIHSASNNDKKIWFSYENNPNNRYQVCNSSLEAIPVEAFYPDKDNIKIRIANTNDDVPTWKWQELPINNNASLYLRAYFPFSAGTSNLSRMVGTAHGGCAVMHSNDSCIFDGCQSSPIMSGSPVFIRPEPNNVTGILKVVGLHLGNAMIASSKERGSGVCPDNDGRLWKEGNFIYQPKGL